MDSNLFLKEESYLRLNSDLECKTAQLIQRVNELSKTLSSETFNELGDATDPDFNAKSNNFINNVEYFDSQLECNRTLDNLSKKTKTINNFKSICNVKNADIITSFKDKINILENKLEGIKKLYTEKRESCKKLEVDVELLIKESAEARRSAKAMEGSKNHFEKLNAIALAKLKSLEEAYEYLKNEMNSMKSERELKEITAKNLEIKLQKSLVEIKTLRETLKQLIESENKTKELVMKTEHEYKNSEIENKRAKREVHALFRNSLALVSNLKKQQSILETIDLVKLCQVKFNSLLEMKI